MELPPTRVRVALGTEFERITRLMHHRTRVDMHRRYNERAEKIKRDRLSGKHLSRVKVMVNGRRDNSIFIKKVRTAIDSKRH